MKKILRIISVLSIISSVLIPYPLKIAQGQNSSVTQLLITEVASTPASDEEWIEIYNPGPNTYTLNTLTFFENDTNHGVTPLHGEMSINAGTVAIIANKAELFITKHPEYSGLILDSSWSSLKQEGEPLALKMSGVVVDSITYGDTTNEAETSQRKFAVETAATWEAQAATAGVLNNEQLSFFAAEETQPQPTETSTPIEDNAAQSSENITENPLPAPQNPQPTTQAVPEPARYIQSVNVPVILNREPIAVIEIQSGQTTGAEKLTINFDGRKSSDPEGTPLQFLWTFGDGTTAQSANPGLHTFANPGEYVVNLLVVDAGGLRGYASQKVTVLPKTATTSTATKATSVLQKTPSSITTTIKTPPTTASTSSTASPSTITINLSYDDARKFLQSYFLENAPSAPHGSLVVANEGLAPSLATSQTTGHIHLNEFFPAPAKNEDEWIEIANTSTSPHDISGWLLADESKSKKPFLLPSGTVIPAQGYIVISSKQSKISLNNDADTLYLAQPSGTVVDSQHYTSAKKLESYARYNSQPSDSSRPEVHATWAWSGNPSPGKSNGVLQNVRGKVTSVEVQKNGDTANPIITITDNSDVVHDVYVQSDDPHGDVTKAFFAPGADVSLAAYEDASGNENLAEVQKISPRGDTQLHVQEKSSTLLYVVIGFLGVLNCAILATGIYLYIQGNLRLTKKSPSSSQPSEQPDEEDFI